MKSITKKSIILGTAIVLLGAVSVSTPNVKASTSNTLATFYHGTPLMWSKDYVSYSYIYRSKVVSSTAWQTAGWIFPDNISKDGIYRYSATSSEHDWASAYIMGVGVPTPWGSVNLINSTQVWYDHVTMYGGSWGS